MLAAQVSPHLHRSFRWDDGDRRHLPPLQKEKVSLSSCRCFGLRSRSFARGLRCSFDPQSLRCVVRASLADLQSKVVESVRGGSAESSEVLFEETFTLNRVHKVEGKVSVRLDPGSEDDGGKRKLIIGCNLQGNWVLHWGVTYYDDVDSEWDIPPDNIAPAGSAPIKDYAMETPMKKSSPDLVGNTLNEVRIDLDLNSPVAAIHFVLKEEQSGKWYHNQGRDFTVPLSNFSRKDCSSKSGQKHVNIWQGASAEIPNFLIESDGCHGKNETDTAGVCKNKCLEGFYEEYAIVKEETVKNSATISITRSARKQKRFLHFDTDVPGKVTLHWGVCKDETKRWAVPAAPFPPQSRVFRNKALQTTLQQKSGSVGSWGVFPLGNGVQGVLFVLKIDDNAWLSDMGNDFFVPLAVENGTPFPSILETSESTAIHPKETEEPASTDEIINEIRNLVTDISAEKKMITTSKEAQESILQEIEKLAAEAYSIFRSSTPSFVEDLVSESELAQPSIRITSGAGTGYEILCQGFNWESHRSGRWYADLRGKASDLYDLGVTAVWLPPPTESISPQGYMPKDLYNLNSSYGSVDDLKNLINRLHEFDIKVVGDVVLNHRCAHYQNGNGIWNIFGGQLNWDDRAVVSDDPHFQGRGNKSSGEQFHAAPNIDHSQEFVRNDLKKWLCWLRNEIGYDGWRLDFVRGFWGGYIKDYMEASKPYFAVGEFWDSLSYTYGKIDHNQDAHRQRIIDWINTTNGTSGAFDITTKGILHAVMDNCEYWRLSDEKGKPPGVIGWWPSRAVTFVENHDTGSTQGHWRFPGGKEMQGYAYILTHPGTPTVFYDHVFSHFQQEIASLISIRRRLDINCRSLVRIRRAERDVYAAEIDEKAIVKIGPGHYEPNDGNRRWRLCSEGRDYKIWEAA